MIYACECPSEYEVHSERFGNRTVRVFVHQTKCQQYKPAFRRRQQADQMLDGMVARKAYDRS